MKKLISYIQQIKYSLFIISVIVFLSCFTSIKVLAQCDITANANPTDICIGDPVTLTSSGTCTDYLMDNDFNNGTIGSGWSSNASPMFNNPCPPTCDGTTYLWIGPATNFPRQVTTVNFDVSSGVCRICFDMKYGEQSNGSPCEGPDLSGEGVHLQYSTDNGANWTDINYWDPNGGHDPQFLNWNNYCENIPSAASTSSTKFRWWQSNTSGNSYDHWGLDNVQIFCPPPTQTVIWSHGPNVFNPPTVYPSVTITYTVTLSDGTYSDQESVVVTVHPIPIVDAGQDQSTCGGNNVTIGGNPTASGSGPTYSYSWGPAAGLSSTSIDNPTANPANTTTYTVTVTSNGCSATDAVIVTVSPNPVADAGQDQTVCGGNNLTIGGNPTASGGLPSYTYSWSPATGLSSTDVANPTANPTAPTTYIVIVTDANGCTDTDDITVTINPNPVANAGGDQSICIGSSATLIGSATGGTPIYNYNWSTSDITDSITVSPAITTTYILAVTDANGCTNTDDVTIIVNPNPTANAGTDRSICDGDNTLIGGSPTASGGTPSYTYTWSPSTGLSSVMASNPTANPTNNITYSLTVIDANGCTDTDDITISIYAAPNINFSANVVDGCEPLLVNFTDSTTPNIQNYLWNFGDPNSGSDNTSIIQNPSHLFNESGVYDITLSVTTTDGCLGIYTYTNMITVYQNPVANFYPNPKIGSAIDNPIISFIDQSVDANYWNWNFDDPNSGLNNNSSLQSPHHTYSDTGTYTVWLIVTSEHGCIDSVSNDVIIKQDFTFYAPNAFTPDGDGLNDCFCPEGIGINNDFFEMYIYNRWGEIIYETKDIKKPWNGKVKGCLAQEGVYSWLIFVEDINGNPYKFIGHVTLVR
jgi:gliding motility-associated-like protein